MNIKGMDKNMRCREFQFEIGKEYKIETNGKPLRLCSDTVFHYCKSLPQVHRFYDCRNTDNRYFVSKNKIIWYNNQKKLWGKFYGQI